MFNIATYRSETGPQEGVTFSVGVLSIMAEDNPQIEELVKEADRLMYLSKREAWQDNHFHITTLDGEYEVKIKQNQTFKITNKDQKKIAR